MRPASPSIIVDEVSPQKFTLAVVFDGRRFGRGSHTSGAATPQVERVRSLQGRRQPAALHHPVGYEIPY